VRPAAGTPATKTGSGTAVVGGTPAAKTVPNSPASAGKPSATPLGTAKPVVAAKPAATPAATPAAAKPALGTPAPFREEEPAGSTLLTTLVAGGLALLTWATAVALGLSYFQFI
jgi:hypothetical protein